MCEFVICADDYIYLEGSTAIRIDTCLHRSLIYKPLSVDSMTSTSASCFTSQGHEGGMQVRPQDSNTLELSLHSLSEAQHLECRFRVSHARCVSMHSLAHVVFFEVVAGRHTLLTFAPLASSNMTGGPRSTTSATAHSSTGQDTDNCLPSC